MNDEVLIKSESAKDSLLYKVIFCLAISAIGALIFLIAPVEVWEYSGLKLIHYETRGFDAISSGHASVATIVGAVLFSSAFLTGVFFLVMYFYLGSCELIITEKRIKGKTCFGKSVVFPLHMISSFYTSENLLTVAIETTSGVTKFFLVKNYAAIGDVLSKIINERQNETVNSEKEVAVQQSTAMDDLLKLKNLFDQGIITKEEFEAKKKQLLGV